MKIVIAGNYGAGNTGDELILEGMLEMLKDVAPSSEITILSANSKSTQQRHNVSAVRQFPAGIRSLYSSLFNKKTKKIVKECDYFILGGGGLFGNLTFIANIIWGIQAFMAYRYKKPVIMYGQSIGSLQNGLSRYIVKKLFSRASFIAMRDRQSIRRLQELDIQKEIHLIPDLAFRLKNIPAKKHNGHYAVVALRAMDRLPHDFREKVAEFLDWLVSERKLRLKFIDFQEGDDYGLHKSIINLLKNSQQAEHFTSVASTQDLFHTFSNADFALTMRLHSIITAIKMSTPFIAINYSEKISDTLHDLQLTGNMVNMEKLRLRQTFDQLPKEIDFTKLQEEFLEKHLKTERLLKRFLNPSSSKV